MSKSLTERFILSQSDTAESLKFAQAAVSGKSQSLKDFGRGDVVRDCNDQTADIAEGKMAEICFKMFLKENFDLDIKLDFNHYSGHHEIDFGNDIEELECNGSLQICTYRVDVKSTRMYSKWLLVEGHKFWSNAYCLVKIDLPRNYERNPFSATEGNIEAKIAGFAYYTDFIDPLTKKPWFGYSQNDRLLNPDDIDFGTITQPIEIKQLLQNPKIKTLGEPLKSNKNYAIPIKLLRKEPSEWEKLVNFIKSSMIRQTDQIILNQKTNKKEFRI